MKAILTSITAAMLAVSLSAGPALAGNSQCGPFGDSPEKVLTGFLPRFVSEHSPECFEGKLLGPWKDSDGTERYSCLYEPKSMPPGRQFPLVVFLHGSMFSADSILVTNLVKAADTTDLGAGRPGFVLLAVEGRDTDHYYIGPDRTGLGWDNWYRQLNPSGNVTIAGKTYKENVDAAAIDHFIAQEIATGKVDPKRIYLTGWSNGAAMALLYVLNRPNVAAAAIYSAPDPFGAFGDPCEQTPVANSPANNGEVQIFNPKVPVMHVRNACDIGGICPNGNRLAKQMRSAGVNFDDVIIDADNNRVASCDVSCGTDPDGGGDIPTLGFIRGAKNHFFWPGEWTGRMLEFLKKYSK
ncbi:MAG: hypothetical protein ACREQI_04050 [Candidatus Binataceae bacterium]